jgi:hypothetical protein
MKRLFIFLFLMVATNAWGFTVLASGQSNMCGRGSGGPSPITADSRVKVWNNTNELIADGTAFIDPPDFGSPPWHSSGANNLAIWFADAAAKALNNEVRLVLVCKGGQPISEWHPTQEMYQATVLNYLASGLPPADVFLWHQGESDKNTNPCNYKVKLSSLLSSLKNDGIVAHHAKMLVGELIYSEASLINEALEQMGTGVTDTYMRFVQADGLASYDGTHFTGQALHDLGLEYWERYNQ